MGFLDVGTPLSWSESQEAVQYVKRHGIEQLLHLWRINKNRRDCTLRWGEEVEYSLVDINSEDTHCRVYAEGTEIIDELMVREHIRPRIATQLGSDWHPEFSNHMIESIPSPPYILNLSSLLMLEPSMRLRRAKIQSILPQNKFVTSQTAFPRFGLHDFIDPPPVRTDYTSEADVTHSVFIPDSLINPHPRFPTLVSNIRERRGANPFIKIPVYKDKLTGLTSTSPESDWSLSRDVSNIDRFDAEKLARRTLNPVKDYIYMDCFAFGMGMSCVQTTFACPEISTARYLYDQLTVLGPLFLALTAATPFQRGLLSDYDTRWSTLEQAVDCRTENEMKTIPKSRYSAVSRYISDCDALTHHTAEYNDTPTPMDNAIRQVLLEAGMDPILADHFAHLWIRDPMVIFSEKIALDDTRAVDHFENIQSTNWNSVRFKPPPPSAEPGTLSPIGWRVEFRTPEIQLTDFDNAAGVALICVIAQAILAQNLDFYIPMSKNDENMLRSWQRDAITQQKFFFRRDVSCNTEDRSVVEMTLFEILNGSSRTGFKGLVPICIEYITTQRRLGRPCGTETRLRFSQYTQLLLDRAAGKRLTCAQYLRKLVMTHPDYKNDSVITPKIAYDLTVLSVNIGFGVWVPQALYGEVASDLILQTPLPASTALPSLSLQGAAIVQFIDDVRNVVDGIDDTSSSTPRANNNVSYNNCCTELEATNNISSNDLAMHHTVVELQHLQPFMITPTKHDKRKLKKKDSNGKVPQPLSINKKNNNHTTVVIEHKKQQEFVIKKKSMIVLNSIDSIYTMPVGVTTRFARMTKDPGVKFEQDLFAMTLDELLRKRTTYPLDLCSNSLRRNTASSPSLSESSTYTPRASATFLSANIATLLRIETDCLNGSPSSSNNHGLDVVSSEDFTQAWILKGYEIDGLKVTHHGSAKRSLLLRYLASRGGDCNTTSLSKLSENVIQQDHLSTGCPSSSEECDYGIDEDLVHELTRSLSLGFETEQQLEYFKQVCESSA